MATPLVTALVTGVIQATAIPVILSLFKEDYVLREVVAIGLLSGMLYLVPGWGGTLSFVALIGLLAWRLNADNLVSDVLVPAGIARLLCLPVLLVH